MIHIICEKIGLFAVLKRVGPRYHKDSHTRRVQPRVAVNVGDFGNHLLAQRDQ